MMLAQVDVVIRIYDLAELPCVRSCIFTLLGQTRATSVGDLTESLHIHLLTSRFTALDIKAVRIAVSDLLRLDERVALTVHNWDLRDPVDLRVPLLNMALEITKGRYLTFLDSSDLLCPGALANLVRRLSATGAAAVLGGVKSQFVRWWGDVFLPLNNEPQQFSDGYAPLLLLDRKRISRRLCFKVGPLGSEIIEFIDRLRQHGDVDEHYLEKLLCIRQVSVANSAWSEKPLVERRETILRATNGLHSVTGLHPC